MRTTFLLILIAFSTLCFGQIEKIIHQDFNIDNVKTINFALARDFAIEKWAGTTILVETKVRLSSANASVLKLAIEEGRYEILKIEDGEKVTLKSKIEKPRLMRIKGQDVIENVEVRIMVPDEFDIMDKGVISREADTNSSTIRNDE